MRVGGEELKATLSIYLPKEAVPRLSLDPLLLLIQQLHLWSCLSVTLVYA